MDSAEAKKIYNILDTTNDTLAQSPGLSSTVRDGSWKRFNETMERLAVAYSDDVFKDYVVEVHTFGTRGQTGVMTEELRRKVYGATLYLHNTYLAANTASPMSPGGSVSVPTGNTIIQQSQTAQQQTEISIEFNVTLMQITENLTKAEAEYPDENSKENKFIKKVKALLPASKDVLAIIAAVLQTAHECGLTPVEIQRLLHL